MSFTKFSDFLVNFSEIHNLERNRGIPPFSTKYWSLQVLHNSPLFAKFQEIAYFLQNSVIFTNFHYFLEKVGFSLKKLHFRPGVEMLL